MRSMQTKWFRRMRALLAAGCALLAAPAMAQTLQLADGQVLLAQVDNVDGDGLRVTRLDNGGVLELRWEQLSGDCAQKLKVQNGLAGDDQSEIMVKASEVRWSQNGTPQTLLGRIADNTATDVLVVQQKGVQYKVPKAEIMGVRTLDVPASQIYTPDEFYNLRLVEIAPGDASDKHRQLAEEMVRVRDYAHAPEQIDALLARVSIYIEAKDQRTLIDQIQVARVRATAKDFEAGQKLIADFESRFPQSKLKAEFEAERKRFNDAKTRFNSQQVADTWRRSIAIVADKKVAEAGLTLAQAKEYAENKMSDDLAAMVAQRFKLDPAEVKQLWDGRATYPVGRRTEHFSYGLGSWVLGEKAILQGTEVGKESKEPADDAAKREIEKIAKALRKMQEAARAAGQGQGQGGQDHVQTDEEWWAACDRPDRGNWLRAYYAEFGGHLVIMGAYVQPCLNCLGAGQVSQLGPGNKIIKIDCTLCHGTKWLRTFKAY
jgi:hypothetical protein